MNAGARCRCLLSLSIIVGAAGLLQSCGSKLAPTASAEEQKTPKTPGAVRAARRAYDGAPPVIPHPPFGANCLACHSREGIEMPGFGYAPPTPHESATNPGAVSRCEACHVFAQATDLFVKNGFEGLRQDLRHGKRLNALAPPVIPHQVLLRENCTACHAGPAARDEIRTPHPERVRCRQCHLTETTREEFER